MYVHVIDVAKGKKIKLFSLDDINLELDPSQDWDGFIDIRVGWSYFEENLRWKRKTSTGDEPEICIVVGNW